MFKRINLLNGFFILIFVIILIGSFFIYFISGLRIRPEIIYQISPEIGQEVVARFPFFIMEQYARASFNLDPKIEGETYWINKDRELHFVPKNGFEAGKEYIARINAGKENIFSAQIIGKKLVFQTRIAPDLITERRELRPIVLEGKYLDLNLNNMTMALVDNGRAVRVFPLSGKGNPWLAPTAEGRFTVLSKHENHWSNLYKVWLPFAINFYGGYYIHEIPYWPGGKRLDTVYSGGCVRLDIGIAKEVFDWTEVGMPVIVHSTPEPRPFTDSEELRDGDLAREVSDDHVFLIKKAGDKKFKRHIITDKIEQWYPHLSPFWKRVQIVPDKALISYKESRLLRLDESIVSARWEIYELDKDGKKHLLECSNASQNCENKWRTNGGDSYSIFTISRSELMNYQTGENILVN